MKTLLALVLLTLICVLHHVSTVSLAPQSLWRDCCPNYNRTKIPRGRVTNVVKTRSDCRLNAVIVTTVCNKRICLDGSWKWAKDLLREFESTPNKTSPSAPFNVSPCSKTQ